MCINTDYFAIFDGGLRQLTLECMRVPVRMCVCGCVCTGMTLFAITLDDEA